MSLIVQDHVLIVSTSIDSATDRVEQILREQAVPVFRLDTEVLPYQANISLTPVDSLGEIHYGPHSLDLNSIAAVWYRRIRRSECPSDTTADYHTYVSQEAISVLRSALSMLPSSTIWVSPPQAIATAELKPVQLQKAARIGLRCPPSLIAQEPSALQSFFHRFKGEVVAKPARRGYLETEDAAYAMYTRRLTEQDLQELPRALPCPIVVQKLIQKRFDIRVTIVGRRAFVAAIDSQSDPEAAIDWRRTQNPNLPHYPHTLPEPIKQACVDLTVSMGLSYAAIDLILDRSGEYYFLEVNPNGQWLWIEDQLGLPISSAVAELLTPKG